MEQEQAVTASVIRSDRLTAKLATLAALLFVGALLADLAFAYSGDAAWRAAAAGLIDSGLCLLPFAAVAFALDRLMSATALSADKAAQAWCWLGLGLIEAGNLAIRCLPALDVPPATGLVLSVAAVALLSLALTMGRHARRDTAAGKPCASAG